MRDGFLPLNLVVFGRTTKIGTSTINDNNSSNSTKTAICQAPVELELTHHTARREQVRTSGQCYLTLPYALWMKPVVHEHNTRYNKRAMCFENGETRAVNTNSPSVVCEEGGGEGNIVSEHFRASHCMSPTGWKDIASEAFRWDGWKRKEVFGQRAYP